MSAMSEMSKAIRMQLQADSTDGTLKGLQDELLVDYVKILGAFYADLRDEHLRRQGLIVGAVSLRPNTDET